MLEAQTAQLGADHPNTLSTKRSLVSLYQAQGQYNRAETLLKEVLNAQTAKLGADHPNTLSSKGRLGSLYYVMRRFGESVPLFEESLLKLPRRRLVGQCFRKM